MTTIVRIGDYLYSDDKVVQIGYGNILEVNKTLQKLMPYIGHPVIYDNILISVMTAVGSLNQFYNFTKLLDDMLTTSLSIINKIDEEHLKSPLVIDNHIKTINNSLGGNNEVSFNKINVIIGGIDITTNKPEYRSIDLRNQVISNFTDGSASGSGEIDVEILKDYLSLDRLKPQHLPFISKFDVATSDNFYKFNPYTKKVTKVKPITDKMRKSVEDDLIQGFANKLR